MGEDFDQRLIAYCVGEFKKKTKLDIGDNKRCLARLRGECERAKRALSANTTTTVSLDSFCEGKDLHVPVSRAKFEEL